MTAFNLICNRDRFNYQTLSFPLNVYAYALKLDNEQLEHLHFGLFREGNTSLDGAQQYSNDLLLARLPNPPCKILVVGVGLGSTIQLLITEGYQVYGISTHAGKTDFIHEHRGNEFPITNQSLEDFYAKPNSYDVIFLRESAHNIDPLTLFNQALDLLSPSGSLLILDEFALVFTQQNKQRGLLLSDVINQATRFNFEQLEQLDLSTLAQPTFDYLLNITSKYQKQLLTDLILSDKQLDELNKKNKSYQQEYADHHYSYSLLLFKKTTTPKWRLQLLNKQHLNNVQSLFELSFNQVMSSALWQWKYASEQAIEMGVWEKGQLIAHYGGMPRDIIFFGKAKTAVQIGDVMVNPSRRGVLTRSGPFFRMAATFLERYIGFGKPFLLGFGFPNERAMKVAEHLALYTEVEKMVEICWSPSITRPLPGTYLRVISPDNLHTLARDIDQLWEGMSQDFQEAIIGVRNWHYLLNRYLSHPEKAYQFLIIKNRINRQTRGLIILNVNEQRCDIIDILSSIKDIPLLIKHAQRFASRSHCAKLCCQITSSFAVHFKTPESQCNNMDIRIPNNIWSAGPDCEQLKNRWWLMAGDMDFI